MTKKMRKGRRMAASAVRNRASVEPGPPPRARFPTVPGRGTEAQAWIDREVAEQERRYATIVRQMDALGSRRRKWTLEFYERIQTRGYCVHADIRRKIKPEEIPPVPEGKIRVVW
jgi:hypothetical protein